MTELFLLKCAAKAFSINQSTDYICSCAVVVDEMDEVTTIAIAIDFFFFFFGLLSERHEADPKITVVVNCVCVCDALVEITRAN